MWTLSCCTVLSAAPVQLEMEYIFSGLEEEALDISGDELRNSFKGTALVTAYIYCMFWQLCISFR